MAHRFIKPGSHRGKGLAVFTSGGDSQGQYFFFFSKFENCQLTFLF